MILLPCSLYFVLQGITKTFVRDGIFAFMSRRSNTPKFLIAANRVLFAVDKLKLDWLKVKTMSNDKLGNHVGDTLLGLSRLMKHITSCIAPLLAESWDEPRGVGGALLPQVRWLVAANRMWLKIRGLDTEGSASDLRGRVAEEMKRVPVAALVEGLGGSVAGVEVTSGGLVAMLARLMAEKVSPDTVRVRT